MPQSLLTPQMADQMLTDLPGWEAALDERQRQLYEQTFKYETAETLPAARQRFQAVAAVAAYTGRDVREVSRRWEDWYIPAFARDESVGFGKREGVKDFNEFYGLLQERAKKNQQTRENVAMARLTASESAIWGTSRLQEFRAYQQKRGPEMSPEEHAAWNAVYQEYDNALAPRRPLLKKAAEAMRRNQQGEATDADKAVLEELVWTISGTEGREREILKRALVTSAQRVGEGGGKRSIAGTFTGEFGRLLDNAFGGHRRGESQARRLDPSKPVPAADKITSVDDALKLIDSMALADISARMPYDAEAQEMPPERLLDASEQEFVQQAKERVKTLFQVERELKHTALKTDPMDDSVWGVMASGTASTLAMAAPLLLGPQGMVLTAGGYANMEREELLTEYPELDPDAASNIALISGGIQAAMDKAQFFGALKFAPNIRQILVGNATKEFVKRAAAQAGGLYLSENIVEAAQDLTTPVVHQLVSDLSKTAPGVDWGRESQQFWKGRLDVALGMLPLMLLGIGANTITDRQQITQILTDNQEMARAGVVQEDRVRVMELAASGKTEAAQAALRDAWGRRSPELAAEMLAESEVRQTAEVSEAARILDEAERIGMIPRIRLQQGQWTVEQDGEMVQVGSREEAVSLAYAALSDKELQSAEAMAQAAEEFVQIGGNRAETFDISRQTQTTANEVEAGRVTAAEAQRAAELYGQMHGLSPSESRAESFAVLGNNRMEMVDNVRTAVSRIHGGANVLTVIHEGIHGRWKAGLESGHYQHAQGLAWVRMAEQASGVNFLTMSDDAVTPAMLDEAIVEVAVADLVGRRKDGKQHFTPGLISRGVAAHALAGRSQAKEAGRFSTWLKSWKSFWGVVLQNAKAMMKARKDGKLGDEWDDFLDDLLGVEPQQRHDAAAAREATQLSDAIENLDGGTSWSLAFEPKSAAQANFQKTVDAWQRGENLGHQPLSLGLTPPVLRVAGAGARGLFMPSTLLDKVTKERHAVPVDAVRGLLTALYDPVAIFQSRTRPDSILVLTEFDEPGAGPLLVAVTLDRNLGRDWTVNEIASIYGKPEGTIAKMFGESVLYENKQKSSAWARRNRQLLPKRGTPSQSKDIIPGPDDVVKWVENRGSGSQSHSLAPRSLASVADTVLAAKMARPEFREALITEARRRLEKLRQDGQWRVDKAGRASQREGAETFTDRIRTPDNIAKEAKFRQAEATARILAEMGMDPNAVALSKDAKDYERWQRYQESKDLLLKGGMDEADAERLANASAQKWRDDTVQKVKEAQTKAKAETEAWAAEEAARVPTAKDRQMMALRTLDAILSAFPPVIRGRVGGFVKLASLGTDKAREAEIARRLDKLDEVVESEAKKHYRAKMKKLLDRAKPDRQSGKKPQGKLGADIHDLFDVVRQAMSWTAEKAEGHAAGLEAEIARGTLTTEQEAHYQLEAAAVRLVANWSEADAARMESAVENLTAIYQTAYGEQKVKAAEKRERVERARKAMIQATGKQGSATERDERAIKDNGLGGWGRKIVLSLLNFEQVLQWNFGETQLAQSLADAERKASFQKEDAIQGAMEALEDLFTRLAGDRYKGEELRWQMGQKTLKIQSRQLSALEAITATLMWRQPDGQRHMIGHLDENGQPASGWHYDQAFVDEIEAALSPEAIEVRDYLAAVYGQEYNGLNAVYKRLNGVNLPRQANYSPLVVKPQQAPAGMTVDLVTGFAGAAGSTTPGSLRTRSQKIAEPDFRDALQTYIAHVQQIEHWKAYAELVNEARSVLGNREVGNAVEAATNKQAVGVLNGWIDYFAEGGTRDAAAFLTLNETVSNMSNRAAAAALVGRMGTIMVQATQLTAAAAEMPMTAYTVRMAKLMSGNLDWGVALKSEYIQRRIKQMPPIVQQAMKGLSSRKPNEVKFAMQQVGKLLSGADGLFTAGTYAIIYDYQLKQARDLGMTSQEAVNYAQEAAERITDRVAQPTRPGARSLFENRSTSAFMRLVWAFASEGRKNLGLMISAASQGMTSARFARAAAYVLLLNSGVAWIIRSAWRDARDGDDDELFDEKHWSIKRLALTMGTEWLGGVPVLGSMAQAGTFKLAGEYVPEGNLLSGVDRSIPAWQRMFDDKESSWSEVIHDADLILSGMAIGNDTMAAAASLSHIINDAAGVAENAAK